MERFSVDCTRVRLFFLFLSSWESVRGMWWKRVVSREEEEECRSEVSDVDVPVPDLILFVGFVVDSVSCYWTAQGTSNTPECHLSKRIKVCMEAPTGKEVPEVRCRPHRKVRFSKGTRACQEPGASGSTRGAAASKRNLARTTPRELEEDLCLRHWQDEFDANPLWNARECALTREMGSNLEKK